ncbi:MAG: DUF1413 domain-containing protein, partial [Alphaproteobacteria bacterium]|nr:DUF1413 domain-containing protein [Alphaproteobacteria bacterium]
MAEDTFKSIKAFLYDRSVSPLFGAFIAAWSVWNYRVIAILLSDEKISDQFDKIDGLYPSLLIPNINYDVGVFAYGWFPPMILTFFYIYVYPMLAEPVYKFSLSKQIKLKEIKQAEEDNELLTVEQSRHIREQVYKQKEEFEKILIQREEDIQQKNDEIKRKNEDLVRIEGEKKKVEANLAQCMAKSRSRKSRDAFHAKIKEKQSKIEDDPQLASMIEALPYGGFRISNLFSDEEWSEMTKSEKEYSDETLKDMVDEGVVLNVTFLGLGVSGRYIYLKESVKEPFTPEEKRQIIVDAKLDF